MKPSTKDTIARVFAFTAGAILCVKLLEPITEHAAPIALAAMVSTTLGSFCGRRRGILDPRDERNEAKKPSAERPSCGGCIHWPGPDPGGLRCAKGKIGSSWPEVRNPCDHYQPRDD